MNPVQRHLLPHPFLSGVVLILWLLLNNSLSAGQIVLGIIVALAIPRLTTGFWTPRSHPVAPAALLGYVGIVLIDILLANFTVARQVLGRSRVLKPAFFHVPLALESPMAISILANTITLTPGTVTCQVDEEQRRLLVHALHTEDPAEEAATIKSRYEARLLHIFGEDRTGEETA